MSQEIPFFQQIRNSANVTLDVVLAGMVNATATAQASGNQANATANNAYAAANNAGNIANSAVSAASTAQGTANLGVSNAGLAYNQANSAASLAATAYNNDQATNGIARNAYATANSGVTAAAAAQTTANEGVASSGVSPGTYGNGSYIPVYNVDSRGRITSAYNAALTVFGTGQAGVVPASVSAGNMLYGNGWGAPPAYPPLFTTGASGLVPGSGSASNILFGNGWGTFVSSFPQSLAMNGYIQLPGGLLLIWGSTTVAALSGETTVGPYSFWKSFTNNLFNLHVQGNGGAPLGVKTYTTSTYTLNTGYVGGAATTVLYYFGIGN